MSGTIHSVVPGRMSQIGTEAAEHVACHWTDHNEMRCPHVQGDVSDVGMKSMPVEQVMCEVSGAPVQHTWHDASIPATGSVLCIQADVFLSGFCRNTGVLLTNDWWQPSC
jgi:hypothetical protein